MKTNKTIYALVRFDNNKNQFSCHIYGKQTSNFKKMEEYREEIKQKYPTCKVFIMKRENAKEYQREYIKKWREYHKTANALN